MSDDILRITREALQERIVQLEAIEQQYLSFVPGGFVDPATRKNAPDVQRRFDSGLFWLRDALRSMRRACDIEDNEEFLLQARHCDALFNDGRFLFFKYNAVTAPLSERGKKSGKVRRKEEERQPYVDLYLAKVLTDRIPHLVARNQCIDEAARNGVSFPRSVASLNKWFPKPKKK